MAHLPLLTLRKHRFCQGTAPLAEPATQAEVINWYVWSVVWSLPLSSIDSFDLRRWDQPEIKHSFYRQPRDTGDREEYTLSQGDPRFPPYTASCHRV